MTDVERGLRGGAEVSAVRCGYDGVKAGEAYNRIDRLTAADIGGALGGDAARPCKRRHMQRMPKRQAAGP